MMTPADQPMRTEKVEVMLTTAEKAMLARLASDAGLSVAAYLRFLVRSTRLPSPLVDGTREGD